MKVYLAGAINGQDNEAVHGWRERAKSLLTPHETLDPSDRDYRGIEELNVRELVEGDKRDIRDSDAILAYVIAPSVGTSMEILYAWQMGIPVVIVTPNPRVSPWLTYHSVAVEPTLEDGVITLKDHLG